MFDDKVKQAQAMLRQASQANSKGDRESALRLLQQAQEAIQGAGSALDGAAPKEMPFLPDDELWGWQSNGGRGHGY